MEDDVDTSESFRIDLSCCILLLLVVPAEGGVGGHFFSSSSLRDDAADTSDSFLGNFCMVVGWMVLVLVLVLVSSGIFLSILLALHVALQQATSISCVDDELLVTNSMVPFPSVYKIVL